MKVFVVAEHRMGELNPVSIELLNLANAIKKDSSVAVVLGKDVKGFADELAKFADKVYMVQDDSLENYNPETYTDVLMQIFAKEKPDVVLLPNTSFGIDLGPYLAAKLNAPIATDVVAVDASDGLKVSKYFFQGKLMTDLKLKEADTYVLTVRQGVFKEGEEVNGAVEELDIKPSKPARRQFVQYIEPEVGEVDITQADIVVTVGRGIEDASNIELAEQLAEMLGGVVAGSRPVIDNGWLPKDRQIGISGKTVKPKLYLGLAVSGAFQHVMGMKDSELIIAINKDPEAPIFGVAQYGIVGDIFEVVPALIEELEKIKG
ncbi:electron transfer flavoprotein alpha subunit apoprotein [Archaeoglobus sulfaticallidus PM70-1]|uniref:Electron transfer flavoprotein alpha subunit apoprotein n=2 Tax=Archaeoglobus TaxID=2233 RepID=N0BGL0_9EURY|nr:electron transfer flavoprotein alpha subunit apoprotein [Archaeoglobus sulfaticallidus PM70-1]